MKNDGSNLENIKFIGVDRFNRPVFKSLDHKKRFYGSVHKLFSYEAKEDVVMAKVTEDDLCYFGDHFDCEPWGTAPVNKLIIVKQANHDK